MTPDLDALFEGRESLAKYDSTREELEAVAAGTKALSLFPFPSSSMETHPFYHDLRQIALELDLSVVIIQVDEDNPDPRGRSSYVFLTRPTELWRASAYCAFREVFENYGWSDAAQHFESMLLGYSEEDISRWLRAFARWQIDWKGRTIYFLLSSSDADGVRALAKRCIDPKMIAQPIPVFCSYHQNPMRTDAESLLSEGCVLARVSVRRPFFGELFGRQTPPSESDVITSLLTADLAAKMNSALESNFQFLEAGEWK